MRPVGTPPPRSLTRTERRALTIDFMAWSAHRSHVGCSARLTEIELSLLTAGVDPAWDWSRFEAWIEEGR